MANITSKRGPSAWFLISIILSFFWVIVYISVSHEVPATADFFRDGPFAFFLNWGWLFLVSFPVWAILGSDKLHSSRRQDQLSAAKSPSGSLGDAGFATTADLHKAKLIGAESGAGIRLGFDKESGKVIRYTGEAHGILVAPARSGKFRDVLCAMIIEWKHSMVIIDPKGQIAAVTKTEREKHGDVFVLNPFKVLPEYLGDSAHYNPLTALDPKSDSFDAECDALADAIVVHEGNGDSHWPDSARLLVSGVMMHLFHPDYSDKHRTLGNLRDIITTSQLIGFSGSAISEDRDGYDLIRQKLSDFAELGDAKLGNQGELRSIVNNAKTQTGFITKAIAANLERSDFQFRDLKNLKKRPITVYVVLPTRMFGVAGKWFRLIVASALNELMREEREPSRPVLAVLDEFAQLGFLKSMRDAMGQSAGMGLQVLPVLQDLNQLKMHYKDGWETFLANTEFRQFFKPNDVFTQEYVSKLTGMKTVTVPGTNFGTQSGPNSSESSGLSFGEQAQPLLQPYQVGRLGRDEFLMFAEGVKNVIRGHRAAYFDKEACPDLQGHFEQDPFHRKAAQADK